MKPLKFGHKSCLVLLEGSAVILLLAAVIVGVLMFRVAQGPMEIGFAKNFIESELSDSSHNISLDIGEVYLAWSRKESRPEVTMKNVKLINTQDKRLIFAFRSAEVSFSRTALFIGKLEPRSIIIDQPLITLIRDTDGHIRLALDQKVEKQPSDKGIEIFDLLDQLSLSPKEIPRDWPLRSLRMFMVTNAKMMVEDHVLGQSWLVPKINLTLSREREAGLGAAASLWLESAKVETPTLKVQAAYLKETRSLSFGLGLTKLRADFLATKFPDLSWLQDQVVTLNGQALAIINSAMELTSLKASVQSINGQIMIPDVYTKLIPYKSLALNIDYNAASKTLTVMDSPIDFTDDFSVNLNGSAVRADDGSFHAPIRVKINNLPQSRIAEYWPDMLSGDPSEEWAVKRLSQGRIYDATIEMVLDGTQRASEADPAQKSMSVKMSGLTSSFKIEGMTVDYRDPLMPVKNASGSGVFSQADDRLTVNVESGTMGDLKVNSGKVVIDTVLGKSIGTATIDVDVTGPLKTLIQYLETDPINVKVPTIVDKVEGAAEMKVNVKFPTLAILPAEKIDVVAEGKLQNILMPGLVHNLDVTGGPMNVTVKDRRVDVAGKAKIDGYDATFSFGQYFESKGKDYAAQVVANIAPDEILRKKFGLDLNDWVTGAAPAKVTYTDFGGGRAQVDAEIDATPATLMVKPMSYTKVPGVAGKVTARAILQDGVLTEIRNLNVETADAKIEGGVMLFTQSGKDSLLNKGSLPKARLKETDVALDFTISPQKLVTLNVKGAFIDASPFLENDKKAETYTGPALKANVSVAEMRTSKSGTLKNAKVTFSMDNQGVVDILRLDAQAGQAPLTFRYQPDATGQKMTLTIDAGDAGAALQAFEVYENARGGVLSVNGESATGGDKKIVIGKAEMTDFKVVNAPILARLVNALSLQGITQLLSSNGIYFKRLESDFTWTKKKGGDVFDVRDGRTSGSSMGLTFDGTINRIDDVMNITGTIVPVSLVNDIIGGIPLIGDILSGGSRGGMFAATYSIKGPTKEPETSVNPLAILTPGFLRRIFFE